MDLGWESVCTDEPRQLSFLDQDNRQMELDFKERGHEPGRRDDNVPEMRKAATAEL